MAKRDTGRSGALGAWPFVIGEKCGDVLAGRFLYPRTLGFSRSGDIEYDWRLAELRFDPIVYFHSAIRLNRAVGIVDEEGAAVLPAELDRAQSAARGLSVAEDKRRIGIDDVLLGSLEVVCRGRLDERGVTRGNASVFAPAAFGNPAPVRTRSLDGRV